MTLRETAHTSVATLLRPVASFVLKCGLTWREFSALAKTAFVAAATEEYGIKGRPTNVSRVALLCGLSRKEVKRQREHLADPLAASAQAKTTDATQVLSAWFQQAAYRDETGHPKTLTRGAFEQLSHRYCQEMSASGLLKELLRVGAVVEACDGRLQVMRRYYMPANTDTQWKLTAGHYIADLAHTISHNIDLDKTERSRFLGRAAEARIPTEAVGEFREFLEVEGQAFLERIDVWLSQRQLSKDAQLPATRLGVGVFQIQNPVADNDQSMAKHGAADEELQ